MFLPELHRDRVDDVEVTRGRWKPRNAHEPSRRWTSGAANRFGSSSNGRADAMSHGPSGESPSTYHVQNGRALGLLVGMAGEQQQPLAVDAGGPARPRAARSGSARSAAARAPTSACPSLRAWASTPSDSRSAVGIARGDQHVPAAVGAEDERVAPRLARAVGVASGSGTGRARRAARSPPAATSSGRRTRPARSAGPSRRGPRC